MNDEPAFRVVLVDPNALMCAAWREHFVDLRHIEIKHGVFTDVPDFDCVVSPANSFGLMDGGIDAALTAFFGDGLQTRVQSRLRDEFLGEQLVGTSLLIETGHTRHRYVAHTPTMRVPLPVARTDHAYVAFWAMLLAVRNHNRNAEKPPIVCVVCPGLATGTGRMAPEEAARQIVLAYRNFLAPPARINWQIAQARQDALGRGGDFALPPRSLVKEER